MSNSEQSSRENGMTVIVLGHEVSLQFAEKPNLAVALTAAVSVGRAAAAVKPAFAQ